MSQEPATLTEPAPEEAERLAAVRRYDILDTPPDGAFDRICALAARFFDVPIASVTIVDEDRIWFKAIQGLEATEIPREPGLCASAIMHDGPYVLSNAVEDSRAKGNGLVHGDLGVRFYAAVPITTSDGHRLGTVNVIGHEPREITEAETDTLAELAAIVMDELELRMAAIREVRRERERGVELYAEKTRIEGLARTLQRTLSPSTLPDISGLDIAGLYQPFASEDVGGDFYDVFPLGGDRWGFFLGDVCGKGPEAATLTSLARYTLRTAAMLKEGPADAVADLNAALLLDRPGQHPMCTVVFGFLSRPTGSGVSISLSVAGHPPPMVIRADGRVEPIPAHGPLLGVLDAPEFDAERIDLSPGDTLLLYTDGILDIEAGGEIITPERLARELSDNAGRTASELVETVQAILDRADRALRDDVAALAMRVM